MYASAITRTTRSLNGRSQTGVGALIRLLWRRGDHDLEIVTFNQDLVIENALEETASMKSYSSVPWSLKDCYEMDFRTFWANPNAPQFSVGDQGSIRILKLHGSLNWVYRRRSALDARNALRQPPGQPGCLRRRRLSLELRARSDGRRVHLVPLIVPPIYEKSAQITAALAPVWARAERAFGSANSLIVFGYSFPEADFAAVSLIRRGFIRNDGLNEISVINPDPEVAGKVAKLTGSPTVHAYRDLRSFTDSSLPRGRR